MTAIISDNISYYLEFAICFGYFHKIIIKDRHKNAKEKKHNSDLKRDFGVVHPVVLRVQQF